MAAKISKSDSRDLLGFQFANKLSRGDEKKRVVAGCRQEQLTD